MNKGWIMASVLLCALSVGASAGEAVFRWDGALFEWRGEEELPADSGSPPTVGPSDLGPQSELIFSDHQFFSISLPPSVFEGLTIAFFLKPDNRSKTEHLISCRSAAENDGFVIYNFHTNWGFSAGDGATYAIQHMNERESYLVVNEWQHVAVTFNQGEVSYYRNGLLAARHQMPIEAIRLTRTARLKVGGGGYAMDRTVAPYAGRMAGIVVLPEAMEPDKIPLLVAEMSR